VIGIALGFVLSGALGAALYFSPAIAAAFQDFGHTIHHQAAASPSASAGSASANASAAPTLLPAVAPGNAFTVLLLGSDNDAKFSGNEVLTQSMILARVNPATKQVTMLSIPRDLYVPLSSGGTNKIDQAYLHGGVDTAIAAICEDAWVDIDYTPDGEAQVAEIAYKGRRLIVRRTRLTDTHQARLWPNWRHFAFLTDLAGDTVTLDAFHRAHAVVELAIRDLKEGAGLEHIPSGHFSANGAWLCCAVLAHNLMRWTTTIGEPTSADPQIVARTIRTRLIAVPARLVNRSGTPTLRAPLHWPWAQHFTRRLAAIRALPAPG